MLCNYAVECLNTNNPKPILEELAFRLDEAWNFILNKSIMSVSLHTNHENIDRLTSRLDYMINILKTERPRFTKDLMDVAFT